MPILKTRTWKNLGQILIIEDNIFMAELLAEKVSNAGYEAISVYDEKEALEKISAQEPTIVLLDLPLTGESNSFDFLAKIRSSHDKIKMPVVILFNTVDPEAADKSLKLGANYYIVKAQSDTEEIVTKIGEILKSKTREIPIEKIPETSKSKTSKETV